MIIRTQKELKENELKLALDNQKLAMLLQDEHNLSVYLPIGFPSEADQKIRKINFDPISDLIESLNSAIQNRNDSLVITWEYFDSLLDQRVLLPSKNKISSLIGLNDITITIQETGLFIF